jgi:hypothetical protein
MAQNGPKQFHGSFPRRSTQYDRRCFQLGAMTHAESGKAAGRTAPQTSCVAPTSSSVPSRSTTPTWMPRHRSPQRTPAPAGALRGPSSPNAETYSRARPHVAPLTRPDGLVCIRWNRRDHTDGVSCSRIPYAHGPHPARNAGLALAAGARSPMVSSFDLRRRSDAVVRGARWGVHAPYCMLAGAKMGRLSAFRPCPGLRRCLSAP